MRTLVSMTAGLALIAAVQVTAQDRQPASPARAVQPQSNPQSGRDVEMKTTSAQAPATDEFLKNVSRDNRAEIDLGQLAQTKASNAEVKAYGRMLVTDHTKANTEATSIARTKNVTLPADLSPEQKSLKTRLSDLTGANFDQQFMAAMVQDHQKAVAAFEKASSSSDAQVKAFAQKTLPTLRHHLEEAQRLSKAVGGATK
jgi:putative membrane protein